MAGKFEFHSPYWDNVSEEAKDLISHLLVVNPKKRFTAKQALEHKWFKKRFDVQKKLTPNLTNQLEKHNTARKSQMALASNNSSRKNETR
jgi:serine/threonine protein kinase